jgi:hypothetical protein
MNQEQNAIRQPTYWVLSKQTDQTNTLCATPPPARFKTLAAAQRRRQELNLRRGPYHPGYIVEVQDGAPPLFVAAPGKSSQSTRRP